MSHFTKVKTEIKDREMLKNALKHLGWNYEEGNFKITQYGTTSKAEIKFSNALGLSQETDGTWTMVGDPYHHHGTDGLNRYYNNQKKFTEDLGTAYAVCEAKEKLSAEGFECTDNDKGVVGRDGKIRMTFQKLMG